MRRIILSAVVSLALLGGAVNVASADQTTPGTPGTPNCEGQTIAFLAQAFGVFGVHGIGGLAHATGLSVQEIQALVDLYCGS